MSPGFARRFWDEAYAAGDHRRHWETPGPAPELAAAVEHGLVPAPGPALDIGCGGGRDALFLAARGYRAAGLDLSLRALALALRRSREAGLRVAWRCGDVLAHPFAPATFRLVSDRGCLHSLSRRSGGRYAAAVARLLAPGGVLFLRGSSEEVEEEGLTGLAEPWVRAVFDHHGLFSEAEGRVSLESGTGALDGVFYLLRKAGG